MAAMAHAVKGRIVALGAWRGREAAALLVDGVLEDLFVDGDTPSPGTIYRALPDRPLKGLGGMFVRTPDGMAFLRQAKGVAPGKPLIVQVSGHAEPGKAFPVTTRVMLKSRYAIATPDVPGVNVSRRIRDETRRDALIGLAESTFLPDAGEAGASLGLVLRSSCAEAEDDAIAADIRAVTDLARKILADTGPAPETLVEGDGPHALAWREWTGPAQVERGPDSFAETGVLDAIDALAAPDTALPGGARMTVEATRALVAVDVDTGADASAAAGLKANLAAAKALPRALRLRGLGGQIVIDPAPMPRKDRPKLDAALRAAFRRDPVDTALVGWTPLGHVELQRQRARPPLARP